MKLEEIMYEIIALDLKDELFKEMQRLEDLDPYKYKDYEFLIKTAFDNIKQKNNESI
jgi:hypothetical protein